MKGRIAWTLAAAVVYLASLVVRAPADLMAVAVGRAAGGAVALADAKGGFWDGRADLLFGSPRRRLCDIRWRIDPFSLLRGRGALRFEGKGDISLNGEGTWRWDRRLSLHLSAEGESLGRWSQTIERRFP